MAAKTYIGKVGLAEFKADNLMELRRIIRLHIELNRLSWENIQLFRVKNGKRTLIGTR